MNFIDCVMECFNTPELIKEFDRLRGTNLSRNGYPIELTVDDVTGRYKSDMQLFVQFVDECIWSILVANPANVE